MSIENEKTLEVYKETAHLYIASSIEHDRLNPLKAKKKSEKLKNLIKRSFSSLPEHAKVFEIGSGDGTNAKYIESLGLKVTASDTAEAFIEATQKYGLNTIKFNAITDEFPEKYNAIFAWRVFVHFTKADVLRVITKIYDALENDGVFVFNTINRDVKDIDNEWVDFGGEYHLGVDRYYNYFRQKELDNIIKQTKFQIKEFYKDGGEDNNKWLIYVLKK